MKRATRDYRHGPSKRKPYKRRSQVQTQQPAESESKFGHKRLMTLVVVLTLVLILGYWIAQHFSNQGLKSASEASDEEVLTSVVADSLRVPASQQPQLAAKVAPLVVESLPMPAVEGEKSIRYTFYQGLAQTEVVVDADPIPVKLSEPYYIVAGTFGSETAAQQEMERLQADEQTLALTLIKTDRYYRLRSGPFHDRLELNKQRNVLRALGADTLLMRVKK